MKNRMTLSLISGLLLVGFVNATASASAGDKIVELKNAKGESVGTATLSQLVNGVKLVANLKGLPAGVHAMHFHEKGSCVGPKFDSAGGHFAPMKNKHGFDMEGGAHAGDMANFTVAADGTSKVELVNTSVTMNKGSNALMKEGGTALVIHEKADDYKSQPSGDAGARVACGEIH